MDMTDIVISGSVATGKSTVMKALVDHLKDLDVQVYHEFIYNDPFAQEVLRKRMRGEISALTFQNFILDKWFQLELIPRKSINIYERLPDDAVEVFAQSSLMPDEYGIQLRRLNELSFPKYTDMNKSNCIWIDYTNEIGKDMSSMLSTVSSMIGKYRYIVISIKSPSNYENFKKRNREGEFYTPEQLAKLYERYDEYMLSKNKLIECKTIDM